MIEKGFCSFCGRKLDADPDRPNDGEAHDYCRETSKILKNLGIDEKNLKEILEGRGVLTTGKYWDCECQRNFIHPRSQKMCYECGAIEKEQPDSRVSEVLIEGFSLEDGDIKKIKDNYPDGLCPDCKQSIPDKAISGQKCGNCGHVFY